MEEERIEIKSFSELLEYLRTKIPTERGYTNLDPQFQEYTEWALNGFLKIPQKETGVFLIHETDEDGDYRIQFWTLILRETMTNEYIRQIRKILPDYVKYNKKKKQNDITRQIFFTPYDEKYLKVCSRRIYNLYEY